MLTVLAIPAGRLLALMTKVVTTSLMMEETMAAAVMTATKRLRSLRAFVLAACCQSACDAVFLHGSKRGAFV